MLIFYGLNFSLKLLTNDLIYFHTLNQIALEVHNIQHIEHFQDFKTKLKYCVMRHWIGEKTTRNQ